MQPAIGGLTPTSISRDRTLLSGVEQAARPMPSISTGARATAVGFIGGHTLSSASWTSKAERQANERPPVWPDHHRRPLHFGARASRPAFCSFLPHSHACRAAPLPHIPGLLHAFPLFLHTPHPTRP